MFVAKHEFVSVKEVFLLALRAGVEVCDDIKNAVAETLKLQFVMTTWPVGVNIDCAVLCCHRVALSYITEVAKAHSASIFTNDSSIISHGATTLIGPGFPIIETSRSHSDTPRLVGLLCTSDQPERRDLCLYNTQHSQATEFHTPAGFDAAFPAS